MGMAIMNDRHPQWCRVGNNLSWKILLCILYLSLGAAVANTVIVNYDASTVSKVIACAGTSVQVDWRLYHNIKEWSGYKDYGHGETFTTLSANPGTTRYFRCE